MERRVRLTKRAKAEEVKDLTTVNQDRELIKNDEYDQPLNELNHPIPDGRTEWRDEERNEVNMPVTAKSARVARLWRVANKSTKLAKKFLGEKAPVDMIEDQALDFAMLGEDAIDSALARYTKTEDLYKEEITAEECPECKEDPCACEVAKAETSPNVEETIAKAEEAPVVEEVVAKAEEAPVTEEIIEEAPVTEEIIEEVVAEDAIPALGETDDNITAEEEEFEVEMDVNPLDGALTAGDEEVDEELIGLFDDVKVEEVPAVAKRTAKKGVQTLGQPRLATASKGSSKVSLDNLWASAPDVSEFFK